MRVRLNPAGSGAAWIARAGSGFLLVWLVGCTTPDPDANARPGDPVAGLSESELGAFAAGKAMFDRDFTPAEGLGPAYNEERCSACHDLPTVGGGGAEMVRRATRYEDGRCDLLRDRGGDLVQGRVVEAARAAGHNPERVPRESNAMGLVAALPLYGIGRIEQIPESAILRLEDPDDRDHDGVSGRAPRLPDGRIGRFGRKSSFPDIRSFVASALRGEMGLTSPGLETEESLGSESLAEFDPVPDPEMSAEDVTRLTDFIRLLALPGAESPASGAVRDSIARGRKVFEAVGCTACHVPSLPGQRARLYSDVLVHDMGPESASFCGVETAPSEWRTTPLAGLRYHPGYLHDGSAQSLESALRGHGGEAAAARRRFDSLGQEERESLLRFLHSL